MTELPIRSRRYARAEEIAAHAEEEAARAEAEALRQRVHTALSRVERAERVADSARRLSAETHQRLQAEYEALLPAAGTGGANGDVPVLLILEILERQTVAETQVIDAEAEARAAQAALWRFAPASFFPLTVPAEPARPATAPRQ